jgi:preprotein translocase subunit SecA
VDIKLGGNAEHLTAQRLSGKYEPGTPEYDEAWDELLPEIEAEVEEDRERVVEAGGLFILGTERHESRRIDNQLRGRSGRQGDPGESRFYLSAEDDLVRLFAGDRIKKILERFDVKDDEGNEAPIEAGILSKQIEGAQKKVEEQNFLIRKRVLEYDDVMNQQREIIYEYRDRILEGDDMSDSAREQLQNVIERLVNEYLQGDFVEEWDLDGLYDQLEQMYPVGIDLTELDRNSVDRASLLRDLQEDIVEAYRDREEELGPELMRELERFMLLRIIDERWREHLHDMDYLREGIHLRGFAQMDPLVSYKNEGFTFFTNLMNSIWEEFGRYIFVVEVAVEDEAGNGGAPPPKTWGGGGNTSSTAAFSYLGGTAEDQPSALAAARASGTTADGEPDVDIDELAVPVQVETRTVDERERTGRNEPCWCGSGKKFKKCHGA